MNQNQKDKDFARLHFSSSPLVLFNVWDAGSAKQIVAAGAKAVATSSWAVAEAQGFQDGEQIPFSLLEQVVSRIARTVDVPISVDFEGGYSESVDKLTDNLSRLLDLGVVGINFEDRIVQGEGLYGVQEQAKRISVIRDVALEKKIYLFINARTDIYLEAGRDLKNKSELVIERAIAYREAGACGFFVPGLNDENFIQELCDRAGMPVNILMSEESASVSRLAELGVSRISFGGLPYVSTMDVLKRDAKRFLSPQ